VLHPPAVVDRQRRHGDATHTRAGDGGGGDDDVVDVVLVDHGGDGDGGGDGRRARVLHEAVLPHRAVGVRDRPDGAERRGLEVEAAQVVGVGDSAEVDDGGGTVDVAHGVPPDQAARLLAMPWAG
ncbi:MAG: hypothetical protein ACK559_19905, partial [bacterium]